MKLTSTGYIYILTLSMHLLRGIGETKSRKNINKYNTLEQIKFSVGCLFSRRQHSLLGWAPIRKKVAPSAHRQINDFTNGIAKLIKNRNSRGPCEKS